VLFFGLLSQNLVFARNSLEKIEKSWFRYVVGSRLEVILIELSFVE